MKTEANGGNLLQSLLRPLLTQNLGHVNFSEGSNWEAGDESSIGEAKPSTNCVYDLLDCDVLPQAISRDHRGQLVKVSVVTTRTQQLGGHVRLGKGAPHWGMQPPRQGSSGH